MSFGRIYEEALLHAVVLGLATAFEIGRRTDARVAEALESLEACYLFRAGDAARQLRICGAGRVRTRNGICEAPDFEVTFLDLPAALAQLRRGPQHVFQLLLENKIDQRGNKHYLFRLGYLIGLCDTRARRLSSDLGGAVEWVRNAASV